MSYSEAYIIPHWEGKNIHTCMYLSASGINGYEM